MDLFDERILDVLRKAGSASFDRLVAEAGVSHNTVRLHLHRLIAQGMVVKEKTPVKQRGRPSFAYSLALSQQVTAQRLHRNGYAELQQAKAPLQIRKRRILQANQKTLRSPKMPPNPKKIIKPLKTIYAHPSETI